MRTDTSLFVASVAAQTAVTAYGAFTWPYEVFMAHVVYSAAIIIVGVAFAASRHMGIAFADIWLAVAATGGLLYAISIGLGALFGALPAGGTAVPYPLSLIVVIEYASFAALAIGVAVAHRVYWALMPAIVVASLITISTLALTSK